MKKSKIACLALASILAVTPAALAGGLGDMNLPDGRFNTGDSSDSPVGTHSRSVINFYSSAERSHAKGWYIGPYWWGYPFGFAVFNK